MKVTILLEHLQKALPFTSRAISVRNQLPILQNLYIEARDGNLILKGTDLELGIETKIPANIETEGAITVFAKPFAELISALTSEKILLTVKEHNVEVKSSNTKSSIPITPAEEYPRLYEEKGKKVFRSTQKEIKKTLAPVIFAAGTDLAKPIMTGVYTQKKEKSFLFVATDGYRLSLKEIASEEVGEEKPIVIPTRILREVIGLKGDGEIEFFVSPLSNQILIAEETTQFISRLIEGMFPSYEKILPTSFDTRIFFDRHEMLQAVKVCSIFARETGSVIRLKIEKEKTIISANTPSVGENIVEVDSKLEGDENEIAFNARYLLEFLNNIENEDLVFEMTGPLNPGVFKIKGDDSFLHLIMPIRVQE